MSKKTKSTTQQIRELIDKGWTAKRIAAKVGCKPQRVYAVRYQTNKARGLGAIGATVPNPIDGIGVPPRRRGRPRRAPLAGAGITAPYSPYRSWKPTPRLCQSRSLACGHVLKTFLEPEMKDIQRKELTRVLKFVESLGCKYKIITDDGEEFGTLELAPIKLRKPLTYAYGEIANWYRPHVNLTAGVGVVQEIPFGKFSPETVRGGLCSWLTKEWGKETYITAITDTHVELMRTSV
jgi:hypothetical protein